MATKRTAEIERRSHLALQARRDALARMRRGEVATIKLTSGDTVTARALGEEEDPNYLLVLAIINKRLRADWCIDKDGWRVGPRRLHPGKDILGVVLTVNGENPYAGLTHVRQPAS
jgi:hypothetical protein